MTDTSAWLMWDELSPGARNTLMNQMFSTSGIRLDLIRVPMGASDFTVGRHPYSYDDMPAGTSDPQLARVSVAHDRAYIIPALRRILQINPGIEILATRGARPPG